MLGLRKNNTEQDKLGGAIRRLKLTPLEGLLGGLILVGLLYLFSVWAGFFSHEAPADQQQVAAPKSTVIRAIAASEKALARLDAFEADLDSMRKAMDDAGIKQPKDHGGLLPGLSPGSPARPAAADPRITRKLIELENRVDTLVNNNPETDKALADRLGRLERRMDETDKDAQKRLDAANQILAKMDDRIKNLNRMTQSGDEADEERFKDLEKQMAALKKDGQAAPTAPAPAVDVKRLDQVEQRLAALDKALAGKDFSKELAELDKQLKNRDKLAGDDAKALSSRMDKLAGALDKLEKAAKDSDETTKRLAKLEKKLADIEKNALTESDGKLAAMEKNLTFLAKAEKDDVKDLLARIDTLQNQVRQAEPKDDAGLAKRLGAMEAELAKLNKAAAAVKPGAKPDTELVQRVESLETEVGWLKEDTGSKDRNSEAKAEMEKRISRIETNVARLIRSLTRVQAPVPDAETINRLTKLEQQLEQSGNAGLGQRQKNLERRMDSLANLMANNLNSPDNADLYQRLNSLEDRLDRIAVRPNAVTAARPAAARPAAAQTQAQPSGQRTVYTVQPGDTLYRIAKRHSVTVEDIQRWNPQIGNGDKIAVGQELVIVGGTS